MGNWESINIIDNIVNDYMEDLKKKYKMIKDYRFNCGFCEIVDW